jgi:hypothetical protein
MNSYKHRNKNTTLAIVEKWTSKILDEYSAEDLLEILIEQTDKSDKKGLFDKMGEVLQMEANVKMFKPETMEEEMKFEAFILEIKPYLHQRLDFLF